jgi:hypothetical protein
MKRVEGAAGALPMECVNPVKDKWRVRWDEQKTEGNSVTYMEEEFDHKPSIDEIKSVITAYTNEQINAEIISSFKYKGNPVWLSQENQFNYKAAYDLAVQSGGTTLPVTFKFGTDEKPVYYKFTTMKDLSDFYISAMEYIQKALEKGWKKKDEVEWSKYIVN